MTEYFDILDDKGNYTGKKATREECHSRGLRHRAVAINRIKYNKLLLKL